MKDMLKYVVYIGLFMVPFLTLYVENDYFFPYITGKNFGFRIILDVVFAAWVLLALYDAKYRPKISGVVWSFGALLIVMFFANLFGLHPNSSFWSNFERMDGYVSLVHTFIYMLVLSSVLQTKQQWKYLLNTSLVVAFFVAFYGLAQYSGNIAGFTATRIDSTLGNAAYMAVYMLFHVFIAFWLFVESRNNLLKTVYGLLSLMFIFVLVETGTRGTAIGLAVGIFVMSAYISLFGQQFREYRKYAIGAFVALVVAAGAFVQFKESPVIQSNPNLARIANISLDDLRIRGIIWGMAWEGVKERPLLGYGQSNFNYIFNKNYDPRLYGQEQWFDRAHNIFMDWLVTGGFLGLIAYLSIFVTCFYYLAVRPLRDKTDQSFTVLERAVLLGILSGYFTHNFVVFDNIVSYIFFAIMLGLINSRVGIVPARWAKTQLPTDIISQFAMPVMGAVLVAVIYFWHAPGMNAAGDIIKAFRAQQDPAERLAYFEQAIERDSFAHQEVTEQISQQAMELTRNPNVPDEVKADYTNLAESQLMRLLEEKPGDARVHVFVGTYYRAIGNLDGAKEQMAQARALSPQKASIINQQGFIALTQGDNLAARDFFRTSFELDEENLEAREYYAASLFYVNENEAAVALMDKENDRLMRRFAGSNFLIGAANQAGKSDFVIELLEYKVSQEPDNLQQWVNDPQNWASLAFVYHQTNQPDKAVETLQEAKGYIPAFAASADCIASNIQNGVDPQTPCE